MKPKIKLELKALKIKSFVTGPDQDKIKGGQSTICQTRDSILNECDGSMCDCSEWLDCTQQYWCE